MKVLPIENLQSINPKSGVAYQEITGYDEDGNKLYNVVSKPKKKTNGSGFVISYTDKICELIEKTPTGSYLRVFFYIAHHQNYATDGKTFGYRCTHKHLQEKLGLEKPTIWAALKYLREHFLVLESKVDGQSEFMVNPNYVTIGNNKRERLIEWSRRWNEHYKKTGGKV